MCHWEINSLMFMSHVAKLQRQQNFAYNDAMRKFLRKGSLTLDDNL